MWIVSSAKITACTFNGVGIFAMKMWCDSLTHTQTHTKCVVLQKWVWFYTHMLIRLWKGKVTSCLARVC